MILICSYKKEGTRLHQGQALAEDRALSHPLWAACPPTSVIASPHTIFALLHQGSQEHWVGQPVAKPLASIGLVAPFTQNQGLPEVEGI